MPLTRLNKVVSTYWAWGMRFMCNPTPKDYEIGLRLLINPEDAVDFCNKVLTAMCEVRKRAYGHTILIEGI